MKQINETTRKDTKEEEQKWEPCLLTPSPVELGVEKVKEQVDIDLGLAEHVHDGRALVLHLQQILKK